jgi:hypothetical protein
MENGFGGTVFFLYIAKKITQIDDEPQESLR